MPGQLAADLVIVAKGAGLPCRALLTDMNQCLGNTAGNALEVREAIDFLTGRRREKRLETVTLALAAELIELSGLTMTKQEARKKIDQVLDDGRAAERFQQMVSALGGPHDLLDQPARHFPDAPIRRPVMLDHLGFIGEIDTRALGLAIVQLGGGRSHPDDRIDHRVGLSDVLKLGDDVSDRTPFAQVHAANDGDADLAIRQIRNAIKTSETPVPTASPTLESIVNS